MTNSKKIYLKDPDSVFLSSIFFILFYLYIWLYIEPHLIYHGAGRIRYFPVFYKNWGFFKEYLSYPCGLIEYVSAFLSQLFYYSWAGAIVITLQAWLLFIFTNSILKGLNSSNLKWLRFVPPILFLVLYSKYTFYFTTIMPLTVSLGFVCLYLKINFKNKSYGCIAFIILSAILYALIGGTYTVFALLCALYEIISKHNWQNGLVCLLSILFIPYIEGVFIYKISIGDAFSRLTPIFWKFQSYTKTEGVLFVYILYLFLPITTIMLTIRNIFANRLFLSKFIQKISEISLIKNKNLKWIVNTCFLIVTAAVVVYFSYDSKQKALFLVDYYSYHRMWPQVLEASVNNSNNDVVIAAVNRALYHIGRLGDVEITLQHDPGALLLTGKKHKSLYWYKFDIFLDLGYVNGAEHNLAEVLEYYGERPQILKRLALVNMIKGNIGTARIYLGALSKMLFYSKWVNENLNRIELDPTLSMDKEIQYYRALMMDQDHAVNYQTIEALLLELLEKNRYNRMAFEYLMTFCILSKDMICFSNNLDRFKDFNYHKIPILFEEAILIISSNPKTKVYLHGKQLNISTQSIRRLKGFIKALNDFKGDKHKAFKEFPADFRKSYFFYFTFFNFIFPG